MPRAKKEPAAKVRQSLASLFDKLMADRGLKNDADIARAMKFSQPEISKARHGRVTIGDRLILRLHETFDIPVKEIRSHIKDMPA